MRHDLFGELLQGVERTREIVQQNITNPELVKLLRPLDHLFRRAKNGPGFRDIGRVAPVLVTFGRNKCLRLEFRIRRQRLYFGQELPAQHMSFGALIVIIGDHQAAGDGHSGRIEFHPHLVELIAVKAQGFTDRIERRHLREQQIIAVTRGTTDGTFARSPYPHGRIGLLHHGGLNNDVVELIAV